ncbi:hypothetical protein T440DRAFT_437612 [Plenodomus tracheiphilus IPT5]|uniref:Uncharacterized protein n=1 Tax=Plenodomus tracheiphilus IPT5 TaxID=1408161 RepID=A0A6A7BMT0_9PLEO|nr:hypothetical protein T440DRAFT_437612 [Plenodomus tracheiphilus IPT5]
MAIRLHAWLNEKFEEQLLLGDHWLREKNRDKQLEYSGDKAADKAAGVKSERPRDWRGLYHDNGSCLDIIDSAPPQRGRALQVVGLDPLTLSDGQSQVVARIEPAYIHHPSGRSPPLSHLPRQAVLAVRAYTIRYTSYGPPHDRLRLILHTVDWIGLSTKPVWGAVPLQHVEEVRTVLQQLDHTRATEDRRRLLPDPETAVGTPIEDEDKQGIMAPPMDDGESLSQTQQPYTQVNFAAQMGPSIRSRTGGSEPQVLGTNRLEPILAGNTQRKDLRQASCNMDPRSLLSLLQNSGGVPPPAPDVQRSFQQPESVHTPASPTTPSRPSGTVTQQKPSSVRKNQTAQPDSPPLPPRQTQATEVETCPPVLAESPKGSRFKEKSGDRDDCNNAIMECSWMKGFVFNSESSVPDHFQRTVLAKPESWYKTQPGILPFPEHNVPIRLFSQICAIADENAAAQGHTQSDDEDTVDPSPDSDPEEEEVASSSESITKAPQDDEPPTSQISWSASSTPEPPQRPASFKHGLPPDSSLETGESAQNTKLTPVLPSIIASQAEEKEPSVPPSSPPVIEMPIDSDEEMEMETSVPQALGEDTTGDYVAAPSRGGVVASQSIGPKPAVQVRETPYAKSKRIHASPRGSDPAPIHEMKDASSASVVLGTYDDPALATPADEERSHNAMMNNAIVEREVINLSSGEEEGHADQTKPAVARTRSIEDVSMLDSKSCTENQVMKAHTANDSGHRVRPLQDANRMSISGSTKRKLAESPTKSSKRQPKRREIKIVGFGDVSRPTVDLALALRKERADSLQRFRETRKSSTNLKSGQGSPSNTDADQISEAMDVDTSKKPPSKSNSRAMSPRHQSLYDEPSPPKPLPRAERSPATSPQPAYAVAQSQIPATVVSARPNVQPTSSNVAEPVLSATESSTIFDKFQAAYPQYAADAKHFKGMCTQMYKLEEDDKMVPKWQWDDFIIRNRTDYRAYLDECGDTGDSPEPYHRFYKDTIRETLYTKGIVDSKRILWKALEELGSKPLAPPVEEQRQSKTSRTSLPGAFSQPKRPSDARTPEVPRQRPRHSLPSNAHTSQRTPIPSSYTSTPAFSPPVVPASARVPTSASTTSKPAASKSNLLSRLSHDPTPRVSRTPEGTGDPFREFYFAVQRAKSVIGNGTVDRDKPWPQNLEGRPTVADVPRGKVDVLSWKDIL